MKYPRLAIWTLAAVHLLLLFLLFSTHGTWMYIAWMVWTWRGVSLSQGCLFGLWAALGGKPTPWRAVVLVIVAATWWTVNWHYVQPETEIDAIIVTGQTFQVMGILLLARFMGVCLSKVEHGAKDHHEHLQFSIGQALAWMTALAVFMSATHYFKYLFLGLFFNKQDMCLRVSGLAVALATTWLICGNRLIMVRCFTLLVMIGLGTAWIAQSVQPFDPWWHCATMLTCEAVVTAASLLVVRLAGYRLTWHWPFRPSKA
jgi:hypothetical protein